MMMENTFKAVLVGVLAIVSCGGGPDESTTTLDESTTESTNDTGTDQGLSHYIKAVRDDGTDLAGDGIDSISVAPGTILELSVVHGDEECPGTRWQWQARGTFDDSTSCPTIYTTPEPYDPENPSDEITSGQLPLFVEIVAPEQTAVHFVVDGALHETNTTGTTAAESGDQANLELALDAVVAAEDQPDFETFQTGLRVFAEGDCTVEISPTLAIRSRTANHQRLLNHIERLRGLDSGQRTTDAPVHDVIRRAFADVDRVPELQFGGSFIIWAFIRGFDNCDRPGAQIPIPTLEKDEGSVFVLTIIDAGWDDEDLEGAQNLGSFLEDIRTYSRVEVVECRSLVSAAPLELSDEEPCPEPAN